MATIATLPPRLPFLARKKKEAEERASLYTGCLAASRASQWRDKQKAGEPLPRSHAVRVRDRRRAPGRRLCASLPLLVRIYGHCCGRTETSHSRDGEAAD